MFRWLAERLKGASREQTGIISAQADKYGVLLMRSDGDALKLHWQDVAHVRGYKRDLLTVDSIVIEFERTDGTVVWSWEEDPAYREVIAAAERYLADFPPYEAWHAVVAFPPFETRHHTLWGKPSAESPGLPHSPSE